MNEIENLVQKAVNELAKKHMRIIEQNCKNVCHAYGCHPDQLILEFHNNTEIKIRIDAMNFKITTDFFVQDQKENEKIL